MVEKMSTYILDNILFRNETIEGDQRDIMLFGVTRIVEDIPKYTAIILISILLNILPKVALVFLITVCYKGFVGGAHARTNWGCFFSSLAFFILPVFMSEVLNLSKISLIVMGVIAYLFSVYVIIKIAPADTEEVPILKRKRRLKNKIIAFVNLNLIYISMLLFTHNLNIIEIIIFSLFFINIATTKYIYKFYRCKYSYESEEFKEYFNS